MEKIRNKYIIIPIWIINVILIILGLDVNILGLLAFAITATIILISKPVYNFYYLFSLLPFSTIFKISLTSTSLYTFLCMLFIVKLFICTKNQRIHVYASLGIWCILMAFISWLSIIDTIKVVIPFLLLYFFAIFFNKEKDKKETVTKIIIIVAISFLIASTLGHFKEQIPSLTNYFYNLEDYDFNSGRFQGLESDPNYYTAILLMLLFALFILFMQKRIKLSFYVFYFAFAFFGILTVSKSFLITFFVFNIIMFVLLWRHHRHRPILILASIYIIVLSSGVFSSQIGTIFNRLMDNDSNITTGRSTLWDVYINYIMDNFKVILIGTGQNRLLDYNDMHNTYIEIIYKTGFIGFGFYIGNLLLIFNTNKIAIKRGLLNFLPIFLLIVLFFFLNGFIFNYVPLFLIICFSFYNLSLYRISQERVVIDLE